MDNDSKIKALVMQLSLMVVSTQVGADPLVDAATKPRDNGKILRVMRFPEPVFEDPDLHFWYFKCSYAVQEQFKRLSLATSPGDIICCFDIDHFGNARNVKVLKSSGSKDFDNAFLSALKNSTPFQLPPNHKPYMMHLELSLRGRRISIGPTIHHT
jgi:TonB family protein